MTFLDLAKHQPGFKAYCHRKSPAASKTMDQILADNRKKTKADFRSFCKPRGLLSILKNHEYVTACGDVLIRAVIRKFGNDFISEIIYDSRRESA